MKVGEQYRWVERKFVLHERRED